MAGWEAGGIGTHSASYGSALTNNLLQDAQVTQILLHHLQCSCSSVYAKLGVYDYLKGGWKEEVAGLFSLVTKW